MKNVLYVLEKELKDYKSCLVVMERRYSRQFISDDEYTDIFNMYIPLIAEFTEAIEIIKKHSEK